MRSYGLNDFACKCRFNNEVLVPFDLKALIDPNVL